MWKRIPNLDMFDWHKTWVSKIFYRYRQDCVHYYTSSFQTNKCCVDEEAGAVIVNVKPHPKADEVLVLVFLDAISNILSCQLSKCMCQPRRKLILFHDNTRPLQLCHVRSRRYVLYIACTPLKYFKFFTLWQLHLWLLKKLMEKFISWRWWSGRESTLSGGYPNARVFLNHGTL